MFAAGQDREAALGRMRGGVTVNGWGEVEVILSCEFAGAPCTIQNERPRGAAKAASQHGCGIVAYGEPMPARPGQDSI